MATCSLQKVTELLYFSKSISTPLPPNSFPSALRMIVIGCIGVSKSTV